MPLRTPIAIVEFSFLPHSICFGADPDLTVITAYIQPNDDLINEVKARRTSEQTGEPVALIAAWDLEYKTLQIYCIDNNNTQCLIPLSDGEVDALYNGIRAQTQKNFHHTPEQLLNVKRQMNQLPPITCEHPASANPV